MTSTVKNEALISSLCVSPYLPIYPHSRCLSVDSLLICFTFILPYFKNPFVFICSLALSLPSSFPLPVSRSLCSFNLWQTPSLFPVWNGTAAQNSEDKRKLIGKHHSPDVFSFCAVRLISLTSYLPLTKRLSVSLSAEFIIVFEWQLQSWPKRGRTEEFNPINLGWVCQGQGRNI